MQAGEQVPPIAPEFLPPWHSAWRRDGQGMGRAQRLRTHPFPVPVFWQLVSRLLRSFGVHHSPKKSDPGMSKARCLLARPDPWLILIAEFDLELSTP